ncbi:MAG: NAD(P)/FAD-dependent oxidoreductase [Elainella sp.]
MATGTDWIVVGNGLAGAALSYELQKQGLSVLLLQAATPSQATRYSYGGIAYWSGSTLLMRQLCQEGIDLHRQLSAELEADTEFRELDLLLTVAPDADLAEAAASYAQVAIPPQTLTPAEAVDLEPLLNPAAIAGALRLPHGHVSPEATIAAYNSAFQRLGGQIQLDEVTGFQGQGERVVGVTTRQGNYGAAAVVVCAGALSRQLLKQSGVPTRLYFTQAELIETEPVAVQLRSLVMPARLQRFELEAKAGSSEQDARWNQPGQEILSPILDPGVVQLQDGRLRIGQLTRVTSDLEPEVDAMASELALRQAIGTVLPSLQSLPGRWCRCQVAFRGDRLPLLGSCRQGLHLFTGFSNPFAILPPLARRYARAVVGSGGEMGRWGDGEVGEMGRWGDGGVGR